MHDIIYTQMHDIIYTKMATNCLRKCWLLENEPLACCVLVKEIITINFLRCRLAKNFHCGAAQKRNMNHKQTRTDSKFTALWKPTKEISGIV